MSVPRQGSRFALLVLVTVLAGCSAAPIAPVSTPSQPRSWEPSVDLDINNASTTWGWQLTIQLHEPIRVGNESVVELDSVVTVTVSEYGLSLDDLMGLAHAETIKGAESRASFNLAPRLNMVAGWSRQSLDGVVLVDVGHAGEGDERSVVFDPKTASWYEVPCDWGRPTSIEPTPNPWSRTNINVKPREKGECFP